MGDVVAQGTVTVRSLVTGEEWDEAVEVFEEDVTWGDGMTVEDAARLVARNQAIDPVETLECDIS